MSWTRRAFLAHAAGAAWVVGAGPVGCALPGFGSVFRHGVASGDPLTDRVVLWTRVSPLWAADPVPVRWWVALDPARRQLICQGTAWADPLRDHTVKVDAAGLAPGGEYYYGFEALGRRSPVGRTRTLAAGSPERVRFAVVSCSNYGTGYFNAYGRVAERDDLDAVLHLGDYLYEYGADRYDVSERIDRVPTPRHETLSLADYRARHALYKTDRDLQALHARHPVIAIWDDHESANNAWRDGASNHDHGEGDWRVRKAAAVRAYLEWMPVRELAGEASVPRIWRHFRFGDLLDLVMLDTRLYGRDKQVHSQDVEAAEAPTRSLLGARQEAWLFDQLTVSQAERRPWRVVGQQVEFAQTRGPAERVSSDAWDGYRASRRRLLDHVERGGIEDLVILTGDIHSSWAIDVPRDPWAPGGYDAATGRGSLAVELIAPAVSSSPLAHYPRAREHFARVRSTHPHLRYVDLEHRGYLLVDFDRERVLGQWWFVDTVASRSSGERLATTWQTRRGRSHLESAPESAGG